MRASRSLGLLEKSREGDLILSFQLCSDCEIHTIAPFSLKGRRRGAAAARPALSWAQRGRVHPGDKGGGPGGCLAAAFPILGGSRSPLLPLPFTVPFVWLGSARPGSPRARVPGL